MIILSNEEKLCQICQKSIKKNQKIIVLANNLKCTKDGGDFDWADLINGCEIMHKNCYYDYINGKYACPNRVKEVWQTLKTIGVDIDKHEVGQFLKENLDKTNEDLVLYIVKTLNRF